MLVRLIAAKWAKAEGLVPDTIEGDLSLDEIRKHNELGYNCYTWPNHPSPASYARVPLNPRTERKRPIKGSDVDVFQWAFVDFDLKSKTYPDKDAFIAKVLESPTMPTRIVDSGNGIHAYWAVTDLDAKSFLRLNRRLSTFFRTDPAVSTLNQLMRVPDTWNVKDSEDPKLCAVVWEEQCSYSAEQLDQWLPPISADDEAYCVRHYDQAYGIGSANIKISEELPAKFLKLCRTNKELNSLYFEPQKDRSAADFRLGLMLFNLGFTRDEALSVLCRTAKASERTKVHQHNYGLQIVEKVWDAGEEEVKETQSSLKFPMTSIADIAAQSQTKGERIFCHPMIDATKRGFRLGDVLGLIGGQGNGKTTTALNVFRWFTEFNVNKDFIHLFVSLEMPKVEIQERWQLMAAELHKSNPNVDWNRLVYVLDNYNEDGTYRELGLDDIQEYALELEKATGKKIGCLVIDHLGVLRQKSTKKDNENEGLTGVCKQLKAVSIATNTFLIIQSQTSRAKNAGGDVELDMDAAFGTSSFESFTDFVMTTWQPLKRVIGQMDKDRLLAVTAFKMAKIRHKNLIEDKISADSAYGMAFDPKTELLREMTSDEHKSYEYWNKKATALRNKDRTREPSQLVVMDWVAKKRVSDPAEKEKASS